ncbi:hypothetical protein L1887_00950 [Cichorium endivia]|nr:hypothetical protein L1887_00950 [Cichorium endivia]
MLYTNLKSLMSFAAQTSNFILMGSGLFSKSKMGNKILNELANASMIIRCRLESSLDGGARWRKPKNMDSIR